MEKKRCLEAFYAMRSSLLHREMAQNWSTPFWWTLSRARYQWNMDVSQEYNLVAQQLFDGPCDTQILKKKEWLDHHTLLCTQYSLCYGNFQEEKEMSFIPPPQDY